MPWLLKLCYQDIISIDIIYYIILYKLVYISILINTIGITILYDIVCFYGGA